MKIQKLNFADKLINYSDNDLLDNDSKDNNNTNYTNNNIDNNDNKTSSFMKKWTSKIIDNNQEDIPIDITTELEEEAFSDC